MMKLPKFSPAAIGVTAGIALLGGASLVFLTGTLQQLAAIAPGDPEVASRAQSGDLHYSAAPLGAQTIASGLPRPPADMLAPALTPPPLRTVSVAPQQRPAAADCTARLALEALPGARIVATLSAPCDGGARIELSHAGITFSDELSEAGDWTGILPALTEQASLQARLGAQRLEAGPVTILDHARHKRVALAWRGQTGLQIHALEFGAGYGGAGHVSAGSPQDDPTAGRVHRLGAAHLANAAQAEIYSLARTPDGRKGTVRLVVEAEVTPYSCGRVVRGTALQPGAEGAMAATELKLHMPECNEIGDILVLKNLLRDVKIARN